MAETIPNEGSVGEIASETPQQQEVEDKVIIAMQEMIQGCRDGGFPPECCIYRVPIVLRELKPKAYIPKLVSIGPFHRKNMKLKGMVSYKQKLFKKFTQRAKSSLRDLVCCVKDLEPKVRASYSEINGQLTKQELVELTLMDAGFIIQLFIMMYRVDELNDDDVIVSQPWLANSIILDLILLENQLPFFVIEELFNTAFPSSRLPSFLRLACNAFNKYITQKMEPIPEVKIKHFTHLIRLSYLKRKMTEPYSSSVAQNHIRYNANALQEAGIKFKASKSKCLLDLQFSGHTLEIPQIDVDDSIEILFRNMIALEQCHYPHASYITEYTAIMDWLIDTYKDVDILIHNDIVINNLGDSKSVASLFNGLGQNVLHTSFNAEYLYICKGLNDYCQDRWRKTKLALRRDYCNTPWRTVASIAGIILLLLTVAQTIFSVLQVY